MKFWIAGAVALAALGGCQSRGETAAAPASGAIRATAETAPADLQLLCASEAATRFSVPADQVLPVASSVTAPQVYQVQLSVGGSTATCVVDDNGTIQSLA